MEIGTIRHSASHVLAQAVKVLFPKAQLGIGPSIEDGFYYDFGNVEFKEEDLEKIEKKMLELLKKDEKFTQIKRTRKEAEKLLKNEPFKLDLLKDLKDDEISFYKHGDFTDLCKGPHVNSTKDIKAVKLLKLAGAYWRGDSSKPMLQRIYGVAFSSEKELKNYLKQKEEAEKRNHMKIGKEMELFSIHQEAPGMPFFHDKGTFIFNTLVDFMTSEMRKLNYEVNKTPIILNKTLWLQSGHWDHYKENMYFTKIDKKDFAVKPMNCPGNLLIFSSRLHSYKELPIKAGEFGLVHRHELSGVLNGLLRVRSFTQDDAHVFCTKEQLKEQIIELIDLVDRIYSTFGFKYEVELSTMPKKAMGDPKVWKIAEDALEDALNTKKMKFKLNPGDGAFYGPKIDYHIKDAIGRKWQCGTIQLDFSMPEKFNLTYEGQDGTKHKPVMLHRAIYGSLERFIGILIEHFAGKFPLWLSPNQVKIITVTDRNNKFAEEVAEKLKEKGIRAEIDIKSETLNRKVREAQLQKFNYIITIGDKEVEKKTLAVRTREGKVQFGVKINDFIKDLLDEIDKKEIK